MSATAATVAGDRTAPSFHRFHSALGAHVLIVPHSRIFDLPPEAVELFDTHGSDRDALASVLGDAVGAEEPLEHVAMPAPQSLSLNVSASCNLSCAYCYAGQGSFAGAQPRGMSWKSAREAVDRLLAVADPTRPVTIGFLGGEPFVSRELIRRVVQYASGRGRAERLDVRFSVTTNGTLLRADDLDLLRSQPFAVTVSVDGGAEVQNEQRPATASTVDGFALLRSAIGPLLGQPGRARVAARATVTTHRLDLTARFDDILALGFPEVGFSPLRAGGDDDGAVSGNHWHSYLAELIALSRRELAAAAAGQPIRLTNLAVALKELHRGASSPYPCGAGGGYFSVSAEGKWYACHRAIGMPDYELGDSLGLDAARRLAFSSSRHVHAQEACRSCWARYLCSGGCHAEATARSDSSCGFIRGWLEFCLGAYCELTEHRPDYFQGSSPTPRCAASIRKEGAS
jgi:uncharacterized protein